MVSIPTYDEDFIFEPEHTKGPLSQLTMRVEGAVQGVGFRWWCRVRATELLLTGSATNKNDGSVCVIVEGNKENCEYFYYCLASTEAKLERPGRVEHVTAQWAEPDGLEGFELH